MFSWGLAWPISKLGLEYISPLWYTASRLVIGTMTMTLIVIAMKKLTLPNRSDLPLILIVGFLQISLYILLTNIGLTYLPAGRSTLLAYTTPLWVMPIATLFLGEEAGLLRWVGFLLGIGGLFILISPWEINWADPHMLMGSAILLLASLCWAISMLCVRYMHWHKSPLELIPWQLLSGTLPIILIAYWQDGHFTMPFNSTVIFSLIYTGILVTGFSYWSGVVINKELPTIIVSLGFLAVPIVSITTSALFMHETINVPTACAIFFILLGLVCVVV